MKDELNDYGIQNSEGSAGGRYQEQQRRFDNDDPHYVKEDSSTQIQENVRINETTLTPTENSIEGQIESKGVEDSVSSSASSVSTAASSAGSIGALAGVVASAAVAAVIIVAVYISTLMINVSLVMADMHSLVFQIEMQGAQDEDFNDPIYAVLTGEGGMRQEQAVTKDTLYLTFEDLDPGKEYLITVRNSEKVFVEKSYFTATKPSERGSIKAYMEGNDVYMLLSSVKLKKGEFYTLVAKDAQGKTLFTKDGTDPSATYRFTLSEPKSVYFTLSINGKVCAMNQIEVTPSAVCKHVPGEEEWIVITEANCLEQGSAVVVVHCTRCKEELSRTTKIIPIGAHTYGEWVGGSPASTEADGVVGHYQCTVCGRYFDIDGEELSEEALVLPRYELTYDYVNPTFIWERDETGALTGKATISYPEIHGEAPEEYEAHVHKSPVNYATCVSPARYYYYADTRDYESFPSRFSTSEEFSEGEALGHLYDSEPTFEWTKGSGGYTAVAVFTCSRDENHVERVTASVRKDGNCYYAEAEFMGETYRDEYVVEEPSDEPVAPSQVVFDLKEDNSRIFITPAGYARSSGYQLPDSSEFTINSETDTTNYYLLTGSMMEADSLVNIYQTDNGEEEWNVYLAVNRATLNALPENVIFSIHAINTVNLHLGVGEDNTLSVYGGIVFYMEGNANATVNVYIYTNTQENLGWELDNDGRLYHAGSGEMHAYLEEYIEGSSVSWLEVDEYGVLPGNSTDEPIDEPLDPTGAPSEISLSDGPVYINPTGWSRSHNDQELVAPTEFISTEDNPYVITGNIYQASESIDIFNVTGQEAVFYIKMIDVTIEGNEDVWSTAVRIIANANVTIYITNEGNTSIAGYSHPGIELQGRSYAYQGSATIYVTSDGGFNTFHCWDYCYDSDHVYGAADTDGSITFYMNNVRVNEYGNEYVVGQ